MYLITQLHNKYTRGICKQVVQGIYIAAIRMMENNYYLIESC